MTSIIKEAEIINKYLCQIKKSLPLGIRLKKDELNDIMDEIEEHIWEKAIESAGDKEPNEIDIQIAISQMGEPQDIASKFTSRSTPYVYISEELYPYYRKYRKLLFWSSILSIFFYALYQNMVIFYYTYYFQEVIISNIFTILLTCFTLFVIISMFFCYLSSTGYIPYEIRKSKMQDRYSNLTYYQKPKFQQPFRKIALCLEISPFLFIAIFLPFRPAYYLILFFFSIVKGLRGFTKKKSVIWLRSLILADVFFMILLIQILFGVYIGSKDRSNWYYSVPKEFIYGSSIVCLLFFLYLWYEVYLFSTLKEKLELYLKELSLIKRINKKEIILRSIKNDDNPKKQNISLKNKTFSSKSSKYNYEFEEYIKAYLKKAKRKLPFWLKKAERHEVIKTIEEEIREAILEFEESSKLTQETLIQNINNLGTFRILLSDYKQQGTPKLYISKELWPWYLTALRSVLTYFGVILVF